MKSNSANKIIFISYLIGISVVSKKFFTAFAAILIVKHLNHFSVISGSADSIWTTTTTSIGWMGPRWLPTPNRHAWTPPWDHHTRASLPEWNKILPALIPDTRSSGSSLYTPMISLSLFSSLLSLLTLCRYTVVIFSAHFIYLLMFLISSFQLDNSLTVNHSWSQLWSTFMATYYFFFFSLHFDTGEFNISAPAEFLFPLYNKIEI